MSNVVLVHGHSCKNPHKYWNGLQDRLNARYACSIFQYDFRDSIQEASYSLMKFLTEENVAECSFVGHSLGNIVIRYFLGENEFQCGRFIAIFPPFKTPQLFRYIPTETLCRLLLGEASVQIKYEPGLLARPLPSDTQLGIITGTNNIPESNKYWHRLFLQPLLNRGNDGLLNRDETLPSDLKVKDHINIHENHMDHPDSPAMVKQVTSFLDTGRFRTQ